MSCLEATVTEPARDHDPVEILQMPLGEKAGDLLGLDPVDLHLGSVEVRAVTEGLDD
jgi:hypothetical protein